MRRHRVIALATLFACCGENREQATSPEARPIPEKGGQAKTGLEDTIRQGYELFFSTVPAAAKFRLEGVVIKDVIEPNAPDRFMRHWDLADPDAYLTCESADCALAKGSTRPMKWPITTEQFHSIGGLHDPRISWLELVLVATEGSSARPLRYPIVVTQDPADSRLRVFDPVLEIERAVRYIPADGKFEAYKRSPFQTPIYATSSISCSQTGPTFTNNKNNAAITATSTQNYTVEVLADVSGWYDRTIKVAGNYTGAFEVTGSKIQCGNELIYQLTGAPQGSLTPNWTWQWTWQDGTGGNTPEWANLPTYWLSTGWFGLDWQYFRFNAHNKIDGDKVGRACGTGTTWIGRHWQWAGTPHLYYGYNATPEATDDITAPDHGDREGPNKVQPNALTLQAAYYIVAIGAAAISAVAGIHEVATAHYSVNTTQAETVVNVVRKSEDGPFTGDCSLVLPIVPCTLTINPASTVLPKNGGTGSFTVSGPSGCGFTTVLDPAAPWLTITSGALTIGAPDANGNGTATVSFSAGANNDAAARSANIRLMIGTTQGPAHTVSQDPMCSAASCATGCCDGVGAAAVCRPGNTLALCGTGGVACANCDDGDPCTTDACTAQMCSHTCNAANSSYAPPNGDDTARELRVRSLLQFNGEGRTALVRAQEAAIEQLRATTRPKPRHTSAGGR